MHPVTLAAKQNFHRDTYLKSGHLAVRVLAGETRKALVQAESHLYRDEGDCAQPLSGLNLVPLGQLRERLAASGIRIAGAFITAVA